MRRLSESSRNGLPARRLFQRNEKTNPGTACPEKFAPAGIANAIEAEREDISRVIQYLLEEGELKMQDGMLHISK